MNRTNSQYVCGPLLAIRCVGAAYVESRNAKVTVQKPSLQTAKGEDDIHKWRTENQRAFQLSLRVINRIRSAARGKGDELTLTYRNFRDPL